MSSSGEGMRGCPACMAEHARPGPEARCSHVAAGVMTVFTVAAVNDAFAVLYALLLRCPVHGALTQELRDTMRDAIRSGEVPHLLDPEPEEEEEEKPS